MFKFATHFPHLVKRAQQYIGVGTRPIPPHHLWRAPQEHLEFYMDTPVEKLRKLYERHPVDSPVRSMLSAAFPAGYEWDKRLLSHRPHAEHLSWLSTVPGWPNYPVVFVPSEGAPTEDVLKALKDTQYAEMWQPRTLREWWQDHVARVGHGIMPYGLRSASEYAQPKFRDLHGVVEYSYNPRYRGRFVPLPVITRTDPITGWPESPHLVPHELGHVFTNFAVTPPADRPDLLLDPAYKMSMEFSQAPAGHLYWEHYLPEMLGARETTPFQRALLAESYRNWLAMHLDYLSDIAALSPAVDSGGRDWLARRSRELIGQLRRRYPIFAESVSISDPDQLAAYYDRTDEPLPPTRWPPQTLPYLHHALAWAHAYRQKGSPPTYPEILRSLANLTPSSDVARVLKYGPASAEDYVDVMNYVTNYDPERYFGWNQWAEMQDLMKRHGPMLWASRPYRLEPDKPLTPLRDLRTRGAAP